MDSCSHSKFAPCVIGITGIVCFFLSGTGLDGRPILWADVAVLLRAASVFSMVLASVWLLTASAIRRFTGFSVTKKLTETVDAIQKELSERPPK